jgi:PAS domain S-box-containing protein/putative nucleotidyltransferase with HDIG domain
MLSNESTVHILVLILEMIIVAVLILFLFRMRYRFGLTPLYITLGVLQPIQTILSATFYVEIIPGMPVSPGSAILFTSSLCVILLVYIYEDAVKARNAVYGIVTANASMMLLFFINGKQIAFPDTLNLFNIPADLFYKTGWATLLGTIVLIIDSVVLLFVYEAAWNWFQDSLFNRFLSSVAIVSFLDSLIFISAVYFRHENFWMLLLSTIIGKFFTAAFFTLALAIYLRLVESSDQKSKSFKDVFDLLSYRQRFELARQMGQETANLLSESEGRFETLARISPVGIFRADLKGENTYVNPRMCEISGLSFKESMGDGWLNGIHPEDRGGVIEEWKAYIEEKRRSIAEYRYLRPDGSIVWVIGEAVPERNGEGKIIGYVGTITDITVIKEAEAAIMESEGRFETLAQISPVGIFRTDPVGSTTYVNPRWCEISGMSYEQAMGDGWLEGVHPEDRARLITEWENSTLEEQESKASYRFVRPDSSISWVIGQSVPEKDRKGKVRGYVGMITDITELKQAETAIVESEARFRHLFFASPDAIYLLDPHDAETPWSIVDCNKAACQMSGYSHDELVGQSIYLLDVNKRTDEELVEYLESVREHDVYPFETVQRHKDGHLYPVEITTSMVIYGGREMVLGIDRDISKRKEEEAARVKRAVELETLYQTSLEVNAQVELDELLQAILVRAITLVGANAGALYLMQEDDKSLEAVQLHNIRDIPIRFKVDIGEGMIGTVAQTREVVIIEDYQTWPHRIERLEGVNFHRTMGVPMKLQNRVIGVLGIIDRQNPGEFTLDEIRLVSLFAEQAALAIENRQLYQGLQQSNLELSTAYEATIEGWSRALDLRDKETEGHTLRVTDLTLKMAKALGVSEDQMLHIRRGALLHDIGKMGVPDRILLKPDVLTDDEWEIMREHPVFAYEMLSKVEFLVPSLDIPYCHHEKWDGTGYPRQLKGEEIPLVARIFAVADVFDALTSDRPYRPAWSGGRALEYIRLQSGKHFDPAVVSLFLEMFVPMTD